MPPASSCILYVPVFIYYLYRYTRRHLRRPKKCKSVIPSIPSAGNRVRIRRRRSRHLCTCIPLVNVRCSGRKRHAVISTYVRGEKEGGIEPSLIKRVISRIARRCERTRIQGEIRGFSSRTAETVILTNTRRCRVKLHVLYSARNYGTCCANVHYPGYYKRGKEK